MRWWSGRSGGLRSVRERVEANTPPGRLVVGRRRRPSGRRRIRPAPNPSRASARRGRSSVGAAARTRSPLRHCTLRQLAPPRFNACQCVRRSHIRATTHPRKIMGTREQWSVIVACACAAAMGMAAPPAVAAEPNEVGIDRMRLATDRAGVLSIESGRVLPHREAVGATWVGYANDPLVLHRLGDDRRVASLVGDRSGGAVSAAVGILDRAQLAIEIPVVFNQSRQSGAVTPRSVDAFGFGSMRLVPKVPLLEAGRHGIDLAVLAGRERSAGRARLRRVGAGAAAGDRGLAQLPGGAPGGHRGRDHPGRGDAARREDGERAVGTARSGLRSERSMEAAARSRARARGARCRPRIRSGVRTRRRWSSGGMARSTWPRRCGCSRAGALGSRAAGGRRTGGSSPARSSGSRAGRSRPSSRWGSLRRRKLRRRSLRRRSRAAAAPVAAAPVAAEVARPVAVVLLDADGDGIGDADDRCPTVPGPPRTAAAPTRTATATAWRTGTTSARIWPEPPSTAAAGRRRREARGRPDRFEGTVQFDGRERRHPATLRRAARRDRHRHQGAPRDRHAFASRGTPTPAAAASTTRRSRSGGRGRSCARSSRAASPRTSSPPPGSGSSDRSRTTPRPRVARRTAASSCTSSTTAPLETEESADEPDPPRRRRPRRAHRRPRRLLRGLRRPRRRPSRAPPSPPSPRTRASILSCATARWPATSSTTP